MSIAIEGTPQVITDGGSYTAETTGSDRCVVLAINANDGTPGDNINIGTPTMGSQNASEAKQGSYSNRSSSGIFFIKDADIPTGSQVIDGGFITAPDIGTQITCITLSGVDQTSPVFDSDEASAGTGGTETISGLTSDSGGICIASASWNAGNSTFNSDPADTDGYTALVEADIGGPNGCFYKATDGTDESFTFTDINAVHEVVGVTFRVAAAGGTVNEISLSESIDILDSPLMFRDLFRQLVENILLTDTLTIETVTQAVVRVLTSTLALSDTVEVARQRALAVASAIDITELLQNQRLYFKEVSDEAVLLDDIVALLQGRISTASLTDNIAVTDALLLDRQFVKELLTEIILTDAMARQSMVFKLLVDNALVSDEVLAQLVRQLHIITLTDNLDISDELATTLTQLLVTWGIIKVDLRAESIDVDLKSLDIDTGFEQ